MSPRIKNNPRARRRAFAAPATVLACLLVALWALAGGQCAHARDGASSEATTFVPQVVFEPQVSLLDSEGAGRLYQVGEHRVCVMEGTPTEMGFQHGRLLAGQITRAIDEGYVAKALWKKGYSRDYVTTQSARMERHIPAEYLAEMRAVVEGIRKAGVGHITLEDIRLAVTQAEILHFPPDSEPGCTNFAVWGAWTTDGRLLHGRNLDWNIRRDAQDAAVVLVWRPRGGVPFMMVGWAGAIGSVSGMNARGLTIGEMTLPSPNATFDGLPLFLTMRRVLERSGGLDDAVAIIQKGPRTSGWNYIIGDGRGPDARALEVDAKRCEIYTPMDPKEGPETLHWAMQDCVRRTNHPVGKDALVDLARVIGPEQGVAASNWDQLKPLLPAFFSLNTFQRYEWLGKQIQSRPRAIGVQEALEMLANGPVFNDATLHACLFDPRAQAVYVAVAGNRPPVTATRRPFTKIDLTKWFEK